MASTTTYMHIIDDRFKSVNTMSLIQHRANNSHSVQAVRYPQLPIDALADLMSVKRTVRPCGDRVILLPITAYLRNNVSPIRYVLRDGDNAPLPTVICWNPTRTFPMSRGNSIPAPYVSPNLLAVSEPRE